MKQILFNNNIDNNTSIVISSKIPGASPAPNRVANPYFHSVNKAFGKVQSLGINDQRQKTKLRWKLGWLVAYPLAKLLFNLKIIGKGYLLKNQAQILVANHTSHLDPLLIAIAAGQEIYFMAKQELFQISQFFSWLINFWNAIPLSRGAESKDTLNKSSRLLQNNKTVLIFPEGTRNKLANQLLPFKSGASYLATNNQVPIIPVAISGVKQAWHGYLSAFIDRDIQNRLKTKNQKLKTEITVKFGAPIFPNGLTPCKDDYQKLTQKIKSTIEQLLGYETAKIQ